MVSKIESKCTECLLPKLIILFQYHQSSNTIGRNAFYDPIIGINNTNFFRQMLIKIPSYILFKRMFFTILHNGYMYSTENMYCFRSFELRPKMMIALLISETFVAMKSNQKDNPSPLVKKVINYSVYGQNRLSINYGCRF